MTSQSWPVSEFSGEASPGGLKRWSRHAPVQVGGSAGIALGAVEALLVRDQRPEGLVAELAVRPPRLPPHEVSGEERKIDSGVPGRGDVAPVPRIEVLGVPRGHEYLVLLEHGRGAGLSGV